MKALARSITLCFLLIPFACEAQMSLSSPSVPNTKVLAIGRFNTPPTPEQLKIISLRLYVSGKIDQWFSPQDDHAVVMILNLSSVEEAHALLGGHAPGQPQLLTFELIPIVPLIPLTRLVPQEVKPPK